MISKMLKYTFLVFHKEYDQFLLDIRNIGAVHIVEKENGCVDSPEVRTLMGKLADAKSKEEFLRTFEEKKGSSLAVKANAADGEAALVRVGELQQQMEKVGQALPLVAKDMDAMRPWGDFDFGLVDKLKNAGYTVNFFICPQREYQAEWTDKYNVVAIKEDEVTKYFVTVTPNGVNVDIAAEPAKLGHLSMSQLQAKLDELDGQKKRIAAELAQMVATEMAAIEAYVAGLTDDLEFSKVHLSGQLEAGDKLYLLTGWIPEDKRQDLEAYLNQSGAFYEEETPQLEENVPIRLQNNSYAKLFEPITRIFALPKYSELDLTPFLAPFFMLFFGLCMGDGGYGLIIFGTCLFLRKKVPANAKGLCSLGMILGGMTILVGILTGSFFGIALDSVEWKWLSGVKSYFLTEANYKDKLAGYNPMMVLALAVGVVQILFGMCLSAAKETKQFGFKYALSTIAWVVFIIAALSYVALSAAKDHLPDALNYAYYAVFAICGVFMYLYNSPGKNIFMNIGSGLWKTYNMATGILGDTLSYIRLFALGLTGSILGGVFNELAFTLTSGLPAVLQFVAAFVILIFGHSINFGLCMIGSFVHPLRLTFVEFYKNASFEGGGEDYKPFKNNTSI